MIKLIIFDYDGVIVDSFHTVHEVYQTICEKMGKHCPKDLEEFRKVYGYSVSECYSNLGFSQEERVQANFIFKEEIVKKEPELYDGISEVLHELRKRYTLVLISSTYKEEVEQKLRKYGILDVFEMILAKEHHLQSGGKVDHIKSTIRFYGLHPEEVVSVGDRAIDYAKGTEAGLKNIILVEYGWGYSTEQVPGYERRVIVKKPRDILKAVKAF